MNDDDIDRLVIRSAPSDDAAASPSLTPVMANLREQIMHADGELGGHEAAAPVPDAPSRERRRKPRLQLLGVAAAAAVVAGIALDVGVGNQPTSAYAAEIVAVAEGAPRLLVDADGWDVTRADQFRVDYGEMTFENGAESADLHWRPAATHADFVADRQAGGDPVVPIEIAGDAGELLRTRGTDTYTALWLRGDHSLELRIDETTEEAFREAAAAVVAVDVETWLDALPDSVVRPADRNEVVSEMLAELPVPDTFDRTVLDAVEVADRYQLGAQVSGAVACMWLDQWTEASRVGDASSKAQAAEALATSTTWPVLLDMNDEGDYPEVVWSYAFAVNDVDIELPPGVEIFESGPEGVAGYVGGLGCPGSTGP